MPSRPRPWYLPLLLLVERRHIVVLGLLVFGFGAVFASLLWELRQDAWNREVAGADNLLQSLSQEIEQDIAKSADALAVIKADTEQTTVADRPNFALRALSVTIRDSGDFFIFDAEGRLRQRSFNRGQQPKAATEADFFQIQAQSEDVGLYVSPPYRDEATGDHFFWLSRRLERLDGSFAGVVAASFTPALWKGEFSSFTIGPKSSINLFHINGQLLMRAPYLAERIGTSLAGTSSFDRFVQTAAPGGSFIGTAAIDGERRAYRWVRLEGLPFILNVAFSVDEIFASWRRSAIVITAIFVLLAAVLVGLGHLLTRALRLRQKSEDRFRRLSQIDGLTGIANRRRFDEVYESEWRRAQRSGTALSLLLIDADNFKKFNDVYGHQAGDGVLRRVAQVAAETVGRPADLVARYGGEELAVLLPETDSRGALILAEKLRSAIESQGIAHAGNPSFGIVTVSIGVATCDFAGPSAGDDAVHLIHASDSALYRAKRNGRNQVVSSGATESSSGSPGPLDEPVPAPAPPAAAGRSSA